MASKRCSVCGREFDEVFFRQDRSLYVSSESGRHRICIGCEQAARDADKRQDRWPTKIRDVTRRHAAKFGMTVQALITEFGWTFDRMVHEAQHAYANGCQYCGEPFAAMGHGLWDLTLDIFDPSKPPHYPTNARWVCGTCNREKSRTPPDQWGAKLASWAKWKHQPQPVAEVRQAKLLFDRDD